MVYAYLQQGRDREARATVDTAQHLMTASIASDALIANYNQIAMEARLPLERGDWAAASRLPVRAAELTIGAALAHFTRGIGAGRLGDTARTGVEIAALAAIQADMTRRGDNDWATVVDIKRQVVTAWRELAAGDTPAGLGGAKAAAAIEGVPGKQPGPPPALLPARELEAGKALVAGRDAEAPTAYTPA